MKLTQKQFFIAGLCLIALVVIAANPSFTDFIASQFDTSGNVVKIKSGVVLTNVSEWGPMTVSDSITASNGFFSLGTAAGELVLGQGSGTGGIFDYSGATKSNEVVVVNAAGRFVSIPGTAFTNGSPQVWTNDGTFIYPVSTNAVVITPDVGGTLHLGVNTLTNYTPIPFDFNIALGDEALASLQSGSDNIAIGRQSMLVQTNASSDIAIGVNALGFPIVSANNVAIGNQAGAAASSIFQLNNVWIGSSSGNSNGTTNNNCVAVGFESLFNVVNVDGLTAIGYHSLLNDSTGATNTAVGFMSGAKITTGSSNTFLGYQADAASAGLNNATAIGALAVVSTSDTIQLGNSAVTSVNTPAVVTAAGFIDSSGTPGSLVAYQGGNRLGATNATFVTIINTTYITNNLAYITNLYATYITNNTAYITNLFVSYVTNNTAYITNLFVNNLNVKNMYVTNNFYLAISAWPGATNNYDLSQARQQYTMTTACAITNFLNVPGTGTELGSVITFTNSTAGDLIVYFTPGGITTDDGARSYTVTNKTQRAFSIRVADTGTNVIARTFY